MNVDTILEILYTAIMERKAKDLELVSKKYQGEKLAQIIEKINHDVKFDLEKLKILMDLKKADRLSQDKFVTMSQIINKCDEEAKIELMLTQGLSLLKIKGSVNLDNDCSFLLSQFLMTLPLDDYECHGKVVSNERLLKSILPLEDKEEVIDSIIDYCYDNADDSMSDVEFDSVVGNCEIIVRGYTNTKEL